LLSDSALLHLAHDRFFLPIFQDLTLPPPSRAAPPTRLLSAKREATKAKRDRAIWEAHVQHGYSLTAIGQHLGLHYTTISKIVQRQQCPRTQKK